MITPEFGSFYGGFLAPFASFVAAYLIYKNLRLENDYKRLDLLNDSTLRLDNEIYKQLERTVRNPNLPEILNEKTERQIIRYYSVHSSEVEEGTIDFLLVSISTFSILSLAVNGYLDELNKLSISRKEYHHLKRTEKLYWVVRYSAVVRQLVSALGIDATKEKLDERSFEALEKLFLDHNKDPD